MKILLIMILIDCNIAISDDYIQYNDVQYPVKYTETQLISKSDEIFTFHYYVTEKFVLCLYKYSNRPSTVIIYQDGEEHTYKSNIKLRKSND